MSGLSPRARQFAYEYIINKNGTQAAIRAGYSPKTADQQASRLLTNVKVQALINELIEAQSMRTLVTADRVLHELARLGFADFRKIFDDNGRLLPAHMLGDDIAASVSSIEVVTKQAPGGEPTDVDYISKIKFWDKRASLEALGRHLKLFTDKHEHTGADGGPIKSEKENSITIDDIKNVVNTILGDE